MPMDQAALASILKEIGDAVAKKDVEDAVRLMDRMKAEVEPTEALLRVTKAGAIINKHRNSEFPGISNLAKDIVRIWKEAVEASRKRKRDTETDGGAPDGQDGKPGTAESDAVKKVKTETGATASGGASPAVGSPAAPGTKAIDAKSPTPLPSTDAKKEKPDLHLSDLKPAVASSSKSPSPTKPPTPSTPAASSLNLIDSERKVPRTSKSDKVEGKLKADTADEGGRSDPVRDKCVEMMYNALASDSTAQTKILTERAVSIEHAVYKQHNFSTSNDYRAKLRSLFLNLKDKGNPGLRNEIVIGNISAEDVVNMSKEEMASESVKAMNEKIASDNLFKAKAVGETQAETDAFKCGRCGQRKCTYYQMQTRSADEPMT